MALQKSFTNPDTNITASNAYYKITSISINDVRNPADNQTNKIATCQLAIFKDSATRQDLTKKEMLSKTFYVSEANSPEIYHDYFDEEEALKAADKSLKSQFYDYLKSLPEFTGAMDV